VKWNCAALSKSITLMWVSINKHHRRMYIKSNVEVTKERLPAMVQVFEDKYHSLRFVATPKNMPQKIYKGERESFRGLF
jgi:hypothetical protein